MAKLTPQQQRAVAQLKQLAVTDEGLRQKLVDITNALELENRREEALNILKSIDQAIQKGMVKGTKGDKGDMPPQNEVRAYLDSIFQANKDSFKGKDGYTPQYGVDYCTPEEKAEYILDILNLIEFDEKNAEQLARELENLPDNKKLTYQAIKDAPDFSKMEFDASQIRNLKDLLPKRPPIFGGGSGATFLRSMRDVENIDNAVNGQVLAYNATLRKWVPTTASGTGDMLVATYDPNSVNGDAFLMSNMNGTAWRVFYTNGSGDVTELALGANGTFLKSNGATSAPTFETPTASAVWGAITGTLSDQTDLQSALNGKANTSHTHTASDITDFDTEVSNNTDVAANTSARHNAVTIAAGRDYVTISGQELTLGQVDLTTDVTGDLPLSNIAQQSAHSVLGRAGAGTGDVASITMGNDTILGRSGSGDVDDLSATQVRTILNVEDGATADQVASEVPFTPAGNIAATDVQAAIEELDTEKAATSHTHAIADVTGLQTALDGKITAFADPNADRIVFWDDSAGAFAALTASTGLSISGTSMTVRSASTTQTGIVELATNAETVTGTDTTRAVTPDGLTDRLAAPGTIGGTTPGAATFTDLTSTGVLTYDAARGKVTAGGNLGATETINFNDETNYTGTLDSNITFTFANATSGDDVTLYLSYDGTAQRTITWPTITWLDNNNGSAPATPSASGNVLVVTIRYVGTTYYGTATGNYAVYS